MHIHDRVEPGCLWAKTREGHNNSVQLENSRDLNTFRLMEQPNAMSSGQQKRRVAVFIIRESFWINRLGNEMVKESFNESVKTRGH